MNIIVAIDLIDGKCVRLTQGDYRRKKIYNKDPLDMALLLEDNGISRLHLVDLDGAKKGKVIHWNVLEKIAKHTHLIIDFGGGIHTDEDVRIVFENGGNMATIGSIAVTKPFLLEKWIHIYGGEKILLGVDVKDNKIASNGWTKFHEIPFFSFLEEKNSHGIKKIFCTDISKDGKLYGPSFSLYKKIILKFPNIEFIASGGIRNIEDIKNLYDLGCHGVIIGKAIYENKILLSELKDILVSLK
ncbi:MAG: 1-(5-phosphoribosyl)-5-[(5-phosphoribosylamino)methylideneamino]imidazole-4-carboxamide isomerase [Flavobacteriales bacterium]|jgi:phosphoribosylformimino-5-aminoimidazole carboxamide ribotide isomerase|uniref:1-(5-phosphoribosyl)-5-[(5- phosphoribosylamino)methylideneamino]imidazole-4- carboxamide isomerase n=1 Tax=Blattabacterium sp. (Mastotermes darwiniensis) TaxID=39768 RepID=UPI000231DFC6|nr:1-(5-phosphoribosyl)-5-[(5-phosphoribosylamino)methylideneamino]imidazole-4-carboxamide isomerase [Blattabacterium sp. (Mastotermes darwiniensis)]AER40478.1 phosphoribosylformimino-5-aminoimidazole carboxamide [Blattabacterium sp. (Mastotermes darwiniensis) str. MADAR]MDR1805007.1 1-(5-phosphoribosyl)-5-[(5-phosphoribosylamino)methylideneamino]imidazole-4-carboxamide isomerase [Flavobacteriales bacterium]